MSFRNVQGNSLQKYRTLRNPQATYIDGNWVRNPSWLPLPSVVSADEKFTGLYKINEDGNFVTVACNTSTGSYQVDWGDGTTTTHTSGATAYYQYTWSDADLDGTNAPVTFQDSGDTVTRTAHGYTDGMNISFATIVTTTGITATQTYYVVNATANTFQVSDSVGGTPLALTSDGTGTILPYKQAVVVVTPVTGGATLTYVDIFIKHNQTNLVNGYSTGWLDIAVSASATTLNIAVNSTTVIHSNLQQANIVRCRCASFTYTFNNCYSLENVVSINTAVSLGSIQEMFRNCYNLAKAPMFDTSTVTSMQSTFRECRSLNSVPTLNTSNVTSMRGMFVNCFSLTSVPLFDTSSVTLMGFNTGTSDGMFAGCSSLKTIPLFNTANVINMGYMFHSCNSLESIPLLNTSACTNFTNMFVNCNALVSIPLLNTSAGTNFSAMFQNCWSLTGIPLLNTSAGTNFSTMFQTCYALSSVPLINTSLSTTTNSMFTNCQSLQQVPLFDLSNVTNANSMFNACVSLTSVPKFNTPVLNSMNGMFSGCASLAAVPAINFNGMESTASLSSIFSSCPSLTSMNATGFKYSFTVASCKLSGAQLDNIFTNLNTVGGSVTFQGTADTVTIAAHGYANLNQIRFTSITTTTGIAINTSYFVRNVTTDTFQLSTTATGAIINLVNDGTGVREAATITVSSNYGITTDTPSIATAKGWTVTGS